MEPYEILTGVGTLFVAPVGTVFPDLDDSPAAAWRNLGNTQDGVKVTLDQKIDEHSVDQETGAIKASRSEESLVLETSLAEATLENLADVIGATLIDTPAGAGTIGTREVPLYKGANVNTFAFLFRGNSAYGNYPAQYELPYGYFGGSVELEDTKEGNRKIGVEFHALVDPNAALDADKFGRLIMQDAEATS